MTAPPPRASAGLTLVELLASVSIAVILSTMATVAFVQIQKVQNRLLARLEMHNSARFLYQDLAESLNALQQDGALWLEATADDGSGDGTVTLTFLHGKTDEHGFATNSQRWWNGEVDAVYQTRCTDLDWCCWKWDQKLQTIYTAENSLPRYFKIIPKWVGPTGNFGSNGPWYINMPQPLRQATPYQLAAPVGSSQAALSGNRYGSPDNTNDLSDYQDLANHLSPVLRNVTGFHIEMLAADGTVYDADNTATQTIGLDGNLANAQCWAAQDGIQPYLRRPRLIRILADLRDPQTGVTQSFSFSFRVAGILPTAYGAGKGIP